MGAVGWCTIGPGADPAVGFAILRTDLMNQSESLAPRSARWLTFGSAVTILFGIAPSQILLALAIVALLLSGDKLSLPPIKLPLGLFLLGTLVAFAFAPHPAEGLPQ